MPLRFVVLGAGAIGGVVGARLHQQGHAVTLVARGEHLAAIREHGLRLQAFEEDVALDVPAVGSVGEIDWSGDEAVLLATKSQDTEGALTPLAEVAGSGVPVVVLQNGVENERRAARMFERVHGVCVMCPAAHLAPGVVQACSAPVTGLLDVGRFPSGVDELTRRLAGAWNGAGFDSRPLPDVMRWKYAKLLLNLGNAVEALCPPSPGAQELARRARAEGERCLRAAGIPWATPEEDRARRGDLLNLRPVAGRHRGGGSSWQSLARATGTIEADFLNGEIVLLGRLHGVGTPVNALLQREANRAAVLRRPPASVPAEDLLDTLGALDGD